MSWPSLQPGGWISWANFQRRGKERETDRQRDTERESGGSLIAFYDLASPLLYSCGRDRHGVLPGFKGRETDSSSGGEVQGSERACRTRNIAEALLGEHNLSYSTAGVTDLFLEAICGH